MTEKYNVQLWASLGPKFAAKPGTRYTNKFASGTNDMYINTGIIKAKMQTSLLQNIPSGGEW